VSGICRLSTRSQRKVRVLWFDFFSADLSDLSWRKLISYKSKIDYTEKNFSIVCLMKDDHSLVS